MSRIEQARELGRKMAERDIEIQKNPDLEDPFLQGFTGEKPKEIELESDPFNQGMDNAYSNAMLDNKEG